jgi:monoamine oxidase
MISRRRFIAGSTLAAAAAATAARAAERAAVRDDSRLYDVLVLGAGLAGLNAARLLESEGASVLVLEGRDRVGGRVFTLDDLPGYPEGGGNGIGGGYARILDTARQLEVPLVPVRQRTESAKSTTAIYLRGRRILAGDWPTSDLNPFPEALRGTMPWDYQWVAFARGNPLTSPEDWLKREFAANDVSVFDYLRSRGHSEAAIDLGSRVGILYGTSPYDFSALHMLQILTWGASQLKFGTAAFAVGRGNQRLPEAMARSLQRPVELQRTVVAVSQTANGVEVRCLDGSSYRARRVVVTLPATALRQVQFDPPLQGAQAEAVATLGYSTAFQVHFLPTRPFWEQDGLPTNMWTDSFAGRFAALHYGEDPKAVTSFVSFVYGPQGEWLDRLPRDQAAQIVLQDIERLRPSAKGALRIVRVLSWQQDPYAGGTFSAWKPGQIARLAGSISDPAGRVHFAGEHTARTQRGMEGAMESGERAALEILERG